MTRKELITNFAWVGIALVFTIVCFSWRTVDAQELDNVKTVLDTFWPWIISGCILVYLIGRLYWDTRKIKKQYIKGVEYARYMLAIGASADDLLARVERSKINYTYDEYDRGVEDFIKNHVEKGLILDA